MTRRKVSRAERVQLKEELAIKISKDKRIPAQSRALALRVQMRVIKEFEAQGPHPYETGEFIHSIRVERIRWRGELGRFSKGFSQYSVVTDNAHAWAIEYGTGPDAPGTRSPWGPNTPTPEFAPFAKAAHHFGGTADS